MDYKYIKDLNNTFTNFSAFSTRKESIRYATENLIKDDPDIKNHYLEIYHEISEVFDRDNLKTFSTLLDSYNFSKRRPCDLLKYFNFDRENLIDLCVAIQNKYSLDIKLSELEHLAPFSLGCQTIKRFLIDASVIIDASKLATYTKEELLRLSRNNLDTEGFTFVFENYMDDKKIISHFFLVGEENASCVYFSYQSVKNTAKSEYEEFIISETFKNMCHKIFQLFNYDKNLVRNTLISNFHLMDGLPSIVKGHFINDKELFLNIDSIFSASDVASHASKELLDDEDVALKLLKHAPYSSALEYLSERLRNDYKFLMKAIMDPSTSGSWRYCWVTEWNLFGPDIGTPNIGESVFNKKKFVDLILNYEPRAYRFFSKRLKRDKYLLEKAMKRFPANIQFAAKKYRADKEFILPYLKKYKWIFPYLSQNLRDDFEICNMVFDLCGSHIAYASKRIQNIKPLVLKAVSVSYKGYEHLPLKMKRDHDVVERVLTTNIKVAKYFPKSIRKNKSFWLNLIADNKIGLERIFYGCHFTLRRDQEIYEKILNQVPSLATNFSPNIIAKFNYKNFKPYAKKCIWDIYKSKTEEKDIFRLAIVKQNILGNLL